MPAGEGCRDEGFDDPIKSFKINPFFHIVDIVVTQIRERFGEEPSHLLRDLSLLTSRQMEEVGKRGGGYRTMLVLNYITCANSYTEMLLY